MQKGQVSFDLIMAIIVALIFIAGINTLAAQIEETQTKAAVRNQEKAIAMELFTVISTSKGLGDADGFSVVYSTKRIGVPGERVPQACEINVSGTTLTVSLKLDSGETVSHSTDLVDVTGLNLPSDTVKCGEDFTITG